jgi:hypothetical protein
MNKLGIGVLVAVVLAGGVWFFTKGGSDNMMMANSAQESRGSLKDLMSRGTSKCTVSNSVENSESSGTVYIADGKMRGDFKIVTKSPASTIESHMISDGEFIYTWSDAMPQGVKLAVSAANMTGQPNAPQQDQVEMYNAALEYDCDSWSADASQFELPAGVTFMDMSAMMQGSVGEGNRGTMNPPSKSAQCNMCDQAPETQRTQCREALSCR